MIKISPSIDNSYFIMVNASEEVRPAREESFYRILNSSFLNEDDRRTVVKALRYLHRK